MCDKCMLVSKKLNYSLIKIYYFLLKIKTSRFQFSYDKDNPEKFYNEKFSIAKK